MLPLKYLRVHVKMWLDIILVELQGSDWPDLVVHLGLVIIFPNEVI